MFRDAASAPAMELDSVSHLMSQSAMGSDDQQGAIRGDRVLRLAHRALGGNASPLQGAQSVEATIAKAGGLEPRLCALD